MTTQHAFLLLILIYNMYCFAYSTYLDLIRQAYAVGGGSRFVISASLSVSGSLDFGREENYASGKSCRIGSELGK